MGAALGLGPLASVCSSEPMVEGIDIKYRSNVSGNADLQVSRAELFLTSKAGPGEMGFAATRKVMWWSCLNHMSQCHTLLDSDMKASVLTFNGAHDFLV